MQGRLEAYRRYFTAALQGLLAQVSPETPDQYVETRARDIAQRSVKLESESFPGPSLEELEHENKMLRMQLAASICFEDMQRLGRVMHEARAMMSPIMLDRANNYLSQLLQEAEQRVRDQTITQEVPRDVIERAKAEHSAMREKPRSDAHE